MRYQTDPEYRAKKKEYARRYSNNRYKTDKKFRNKQQERNKIYRREKYRTDIKFKKSNLNSKLKHIYNITLDEFNRLAEKQNNKCAICNQQKRLVVDHDHDTQKVRGLLCVKCNNLMAGVDWYCENQSLIDAYLIEK